MDTVSFSDQDIVNAMPPPPQSVRVRDLMRRLGGSKADRFILKDRLEVLAQEGRIVRMGARRYGRANDGDVITGTLTVTRRGFGFIALDGGGSDIYVRGENLGSAMHRDRVQAQVFDGSRGRQEARVTKVLEVTRGRLVLAAVTSTLLPTQIKMVGMTGSKMRLAPMQMIQMIYPMT